VWLIDDVSTTGATLHAAATALRKLPKGLKPASINAAVICITDHESPPPLTEILGDFALAPPLS
jgi:hypoxanthine phosphoribosyltransferase